MPNSNSAGLFSDLFYLIYTQYIPSIIYQVMTIVYFCCEFCVRVKLQFFMFLELIFRNIVLPRSFSKFLSRYFSGTPPMIPASKMLHSHFKQSAKKSVKKLHGTTLNQFKTQATFMPNFLLFFQA